MYLKQTPLSFTLTGFGKWFSESQEASRDFTADPSTLIFYSAQIDAALIIQKPKTKEPLGKTWCPDWTGMRKRLSDHSATLDLHHFPDDPHVSADVSLRQASPQADDDWPQYVTTATCRGECSNGCVCDCKLQRSSANQDQFTVEDNQIQPLWLHVGLFHQKRHISCLCCRVGSTEGACAFRLVQILWYYFVVVTGV